MRTRILLASVALGIGAGLCAPAGAGDGCGGSSVCGTCDLPVDVLCDNCPVPGTPVDPPYKCPCLVWTVTNGCWNP